MEKIKVIVYRVCRSTAVPTKLLLAFCFNDATSEALKSLDGKGLVDVLGVEEVRLSESLPD